MQLWDRQVKVVGVICSVALHFNMDLRLIVFATIITSYHCEKRIAHTKLGIDTSLDQLQVAQLPPLVKSGGKIENATFAGENSVSSGHLGIIGGLTTNITDHPYQVAIDNGKKFVCSGALLNRVWVIALASCTLGAKASKLEVRVGSDNNLYGGTLYNVSLIVNHPNFSYKEMDYDFALIKLVTYICYDKYTSQVEISLLPPKNKYVGVISGWGTDKEKQKVYKELEMRIIYNKWCQNKYSVSGDNITDRMFCAVSGKNGPCYSDFGDPLVVNGTLYGLYSWSRGCGNPNYPAVFSNLAVVADWIHSTMNNNDYCTCANF